MTFPQSVVGTLVYETDGHLILLSNEMPCQLLALQLDPNRRDGGEIEHGRGEGNEGGREAGQSK